MVKPHKYSYIFLQFTNTHSFLRSLMQNTTNVKKYPKCENFNLYMGGDINLWSSFFKD